MIENKFNQAHRTDGLPKLFKALGGMIKNVANSTFHQFYEFVRDPRLQHEMIKQRAEHDAWPLRKFGCDLL